MPSIPFRPDLQFELFDSLGLDPTTTTITASVVQQAWRRVNLHLHPDKIRAATHVPAFPTYAQARQAKDYLLAEERGASNAQSCIRIALAGGKHRYRSTWNPWAAPNTDAVLQPIPGAPTVASHGPVNTGADREDVDSPRAGNDGRQGPRGDSLREDWVRAGYEARYRAERAFAERTRQRPFGDHNPRGMTRVEADGFAREQGSRDCGMEEFERRVAAFVEEEGRATAQDHYWRDASTWWWSEAEERRWWDAFEKARDRGAACVRFWHERGQDRERRDHWTNAHLLLISGIPVTRPQRAVEWALYFDELWLAFGPSMGLVDPETGRLSTVETLKVYTAPQS
ncbi:hypothetical protein MMC26_006245 [Xylographa opegraphella]|nr:hypothetical protein [Xylographa opegraphella]